MVKSHIFLPNYTKSALFMPPMSGLFVTLMFSFHLSADSKGEEQPVSSESLRESLKKELEFYFSR